MGGSKSIRWPGALLALGAWNLSGQPAAGDLDYDRATGQASASGPLVSMGPRVHLNALDPAVRNWHLPQELFQEYRWRQWESTNYALSGYERYTDFDRNGNNFYDLYGNFLNRGWLIYNASQANNQEFGVSLFQDGRYSTWFNNAVLLADQKGQYYYALTISSDLRTTFTPLVLSKPALNGLQVDVALDKYQMTLIYSQLTNPKLSFSQSGATPLRDLARDEINTNSTTLLAGRLTTQIGDFVELGAHSVHAHQANSATDKAVGDLLTGTLTQAQNGTINSIEILLRDDSPEDGEGGAAFFPDASDVIITYRDGQVDTGKELRFEPLIAGGREHPGFVEASGSAETRLTYDFEADAFVNLAKNDRSDIVEVQFRLVLANDYQVWISSDRQVNSRGEPVPLLVTQAEDNVRDFSNVQEVTFEYGLPTGVHILGGTLKVQDVLGLELYAEYDASWSYRKYPNPLQKEQRAASGIAGERNAPAWMINVTKDAYPFFLFGEGYSIDPRYNTQTFVTSDNGVVDYGSRFQLLDLVDDNDDQDRHADNIRFDQKKSDVRLFPGWDLDNDFVPDFNVNDNRLLSNRVPDFEEPFLRFWSDRPEFLFGVDMNNNFWVDLYENDDEPEYPYGKDHRGFNLYGGVHLVRGLELKVGLLRDELISSDRRNHSSYAVLTLDRNSAKYGRLRAFEMTRLVKDDIADDIFQWAPNSSLAPQTVVVGFDNFGNPRTTSVFEEFTQIQDPLIAQDTWVNQLFIGHGLQRGPFNIQSKVNYYRARQLMSRGRRERLGLSASDFFFGVINKAWYRYELGGFDFEPRWKSEFRKETLGLFGGEVNDEINGPHGTKLSQLLSIVAGRNMLRDTRLQGGIEYLYFNDFDGSARDFNSVSWALQFANTSAYQGNVIQALVGFLIVHKDFAEFESTTETQTFITIYAGLGREGTRTRQYY